MTMQLSYNMGPKIYAQSFPASLIFMLTKFQVKLRQRQRGHF